MSNSSAIHTTPFGQRRFAPLAFRVAATAVLFGVLAFGSLYLFQQDARVVAIWPANAVLLGIVLRVPRRDWSAYFAAALGINVLANVATGDPWGPALLLAACNGLEVVSAGWMIRRFVPARLHGLNATQLAKLCAFAAGLGPLLPATLAAGFLSGTHHGDFVTIWRTWYASDALGMLLLAPVLLSISRDGLMRIWSGARRGEAVFVLLAVAAVAIATFGQDRVPLLFLIFPVFLVAAFRLGVAGSGAATLIVAVIAITLTRTDHGPIKMIEGLSDADRVLWIQVFLAVLSLSAVPVAALLRDRERLQRRQQQQFAELQASHRLLELAERYGHVGYWRLDVTGRTIEWSAETYRLTGLDPARFALTLASSFDPFHPDDRAMMEAAVRRAIKAGEGYAVPARIVRPDGEIRHVTCRGVPEADASGRVVAIFGVVIDQTDQKNGEQALQAAKETAEHATRAKSDFLSSMSHELRTPLNAVIGFSEFLLDHPHEPLSAAQREYLGYIHRSGRQLLDLVQDVLDLSKIEAGHLNVAMADVDVAKVLDDLVVTMAPLAEKHGVSLTIAGGERRLPWVRADRARLLQVLVNLVSNGIKYNRHGGSVVISAAISPVGHRMQIAVTDSGHGIPAARQDELFKPFSRLGAENRGIEGTGIGLVICRHLMSLMGGEIGFVSEPGQGSRFWIELALRGEGGETGAARRDMAEAERA